ncbi:MAG: DUF2079 domain-containing protein [Elusimicrobiota bacterium]
MKKYFYLMIFVIIFLGIFNALFPWHFSIQTEFFGSPLSIRSLKTFIIIILALVGLWVIFFKNGITFFSQLRQYLDQLSLQRQVILFFLLWCCYVSGVVSYKLYAHTSLQTHALDLGFFSNICFNTAYGHWFYSSLLEQCFMAIHTNWILWPISFFYKFYPGAEVLLVFQALFIASGIPVLGLIIKKLTGSFSYSLIGFLLYASSPYIAHNIQNDFHPDSWQIPMLFLALLAWISGKKVATFLFALFALFAKEDVSIVLTGFGIFLVFQKGWKKVGFCLILCALGIFIYQFKFFIPTFIQTGETSLMAERYPIFGKTTREIIINMFFNPGALFQALCYYPQKYFTSLCYIFPVLGLPLLSPLFLIPVILSLAPHILSQAQTQLNLADIYALPSQAFLFVGAVFGFMKLNQKPWFINKRQICLGAIFITAAIGVYCSPKFSRFTHKNKILAFEEIKKIIPFDASLAGQQNLLPHFDSRRFVQIFPVGDHMGVLQIKHLANPEYIVCDRKGNSIPYTLKELTQSIGELEQSPSYEKIFEKEDLLVFKLKSSSEKIWVYQ